jgi:uncharacterized protein YjbI with pentapeptide repeats
MYVVIHDGGIIKICEKNCFNAKGYAQCSIFPYTKEGKDEAIIYAHSLIKEEKARIENRLKNLAESEALLISPTLNPVKDYSNRNYSNWFFGGIDLEGADFTGADLKGATFKNVNLRRANFEKADLGGTEFINADLDGANFKNTKIDDAIWIDSNLDGVEK